METITLDDYSITVNCLFDSIPAKPVVVNTINAYSWVMADKDPQFREALKQGDYLLPDGVAIVMAARI